MICEYSGGCAVECGEDLFFVPGNDIAAWHYLCLDHVALIWPEGVPEDCYDPGEDYDENEHECDNECDASGCSYLDQASDENPYVD